jgi:sulfatase maturation enzyme AslB (radical SAM superfamily)
MKYACSMPWTHSKLNVQGHISPCCLFDTGHDAHHHLRTQVGFPQVKDGMQSAIDSEYMETIRQRMLSGENLPECHRCYTAEKNGVDSQRTNYRRLGWDKYIGQKPKVRFLETAFSTHCNLACRMCGEEFSSKWKLINNPKQSPDTAIVNYDLNVYDADLSELEVVKVLGGEPFLSKDHDAFLENIISRSNNPENITLIYHTNGTIFPKQNVIDMWKKLKEVEIALSIDGHGKLNEYLRPGHKWRTIQSNIQKFKELDVTISNQAVIHNLNIMHIVEFAKWQEQVFGNLEAFNILTIPEHMSISNMSPELKKKAAVKLNEFLELWPKQTELVSWALEIMKRPGEKQTWEIMKEKHKKLDEYFGQNFSDYNK